MTDHLIGTEITTCKPRRAREATGLPQSAYVYSDEVIRLYGQYRRGQTPRARDLTLHVDGTPPYRDPGHGVSSFLFNARLADFRKYLEENEVGRFSHEDDEWVQLVIRGVNTQNRVRAHDFRSNEPEQLELQRLFREQNVFYERKRGEWREFRNEPRFRSFRRTTLRALGQVLAAVSEYDGSGVVLVKRGVEVIFRDHYSDFFPTRKKIGRQFERIYLAYRVAEFVRRTAYGPAREFQKQRHAFWTTVWLFHLGLTDLAHLHTNTTTPKIKAAFDRFEGSGKIGGDARGLAKRTRKVVWAAWREARSADVEHWSSVNFFKSKWAHQKVRQLALPKVKRDLQALGRSLLAGN